MSNETAVADPLSGTEVIEAIVAKVREQLRRDCFLSPNAAYEYFTGEIRIKIRAIDVGRNAEVDTTANVAGGTPPEDPTDPRIETNESETNIEQEPPNVVRRESGQSVPVTVEDGTGKTESKRVKYAPKAPK